MTRESGSLVEAARSDLNDLKSRLDDARESLAASGGTKEHSETIETAWNNLQTQWQKLQAAGDTASTELRNEFEDAKARFRHVVDTYHQS